MGERTEQERLPIADGQWAPRLSGRYRLLRAAVVVGVGILVVLALWQEPLYSVVRR